MSMRNVSLLAIVVACSLIGAEAGLKFGCAISNSPVCSRDSSRLRHHYDGIDNFLRNSMPTEDVDTTMKVIEDWIRRESSHRLGPNEALRLQALIQLHSLVQTDGPGRCTLSSSRILQSNDLSLRGAISKLLPGEIPKRRIERLVNHYAVKFERECDYAQAIKDMDSKQLAYVATMVGQYVGARAKDEMSGGLFQPRQLDSQLFIEQQAQQASHFAKNMRGVRPQRDAAIIYRWLFKLAQDNYDPLVQHLFASPADDSAGLEKLFRRYLIEPCHQFVERVESSFGSTWALAQSKKTHKRLNTEGPLYKSLTYFHGCRLILSNEETLLNGLKAMLRAKKPSQTERLTP